jgi:hypothetical protein
VCGLASSGSGYDILTEYCERRSETSGSIKFERFFQSLLASQGLSSMELFSYVVLFRNAA